MLRIGQSPPCEFLFVAFPRSNLRYPKAIGGECWQHLMGALKIGFGLFQRFSIPTSIEIPPKNPQKQVLRSYGNNHNPSSTFKFSLVHPQPTRFWMMQGFYLIHFQEEDTRLSRDVIDSFCIPQIYVALHATHPIFLFEPVKSSQINQNVFGFLFDKISHRVHFVSCHLSHVA